MGDRNYRLFAWDSNSNLESLGDYLDEDGEIGIGAEIRTDGGVGSYVKVLEMLTANPSRIKRSDGTVYMPDSIAIVEVI